MSIGARSHGGRTYLQGHIDEFSDCDLKELVKHALKAIRASMRVSDNLSAEVGFLNISTYMKVDFNVSLSFSEIFH